LLQQRLPLRLRRRAPAARLRHPALPRQLLLAMPTPHPSCAEASRAFSAATSSIARFRPRHIAAPQTCPERAPRCQTSARSSSTKCAAATTRLTATLAWRRTRAFRYWRRGPVKRPTPRPRVGCAARAGLHKTARRACIASTSPTAARPTRAAFAAKSRRCAPRSTSRCAAATARPTAAPARPPPKAQASSATARVSSRGGPSARKLAERATLRVGAGQARTLLNQRRDGAERPGPGGFQLGAPIFAADFGQRAQERVANPTVHFVGHAVVDVFGAERVQRAGEPRRV